MVLGMIFKIILESVHLLIDEFNLASDRDELVQLFIHAIEAIINLVQSVVQNFMEHVAFPPCNVFIITHVMFLQAHDGFDSNSTSPLNPHILLDPPLTVISPVLGTVYPDAAADALWTATAWR